MQSTRGKPVVVGDRVSAAGVLVANGTGHRLLLRGEGLYGELVGETDYFALPVSDLTGPQPGGMVTVHGVWTGEAIVDAVAAEGGRGVESFAGLDRTTFPDVDGVADRSEILRPEVHDACDAIRGDALVALLAARGPHGWFGLASAVDVGAVREVLTPVLGAHLHVVPSAWSREEVERAEKAAIATEPEPYAFGVGWDAEGRYRAHVLVPHVSPALASVVTQFPEEILHVEAWLTRSEEGAPGVGPVAAGNPALPPPRGSL